MEALTSKRPTVSLCMIVKNEAPRLEGCLEPLLPLVDEAVIVDTGSTDDTIQVARSFGARVLRRKWRDSFAQARNVSLDAATGDWILVVDADERIDERNRRRLKRLLASLASTTVDAFRFRVLNWWCEGAQRELAKFILFRRHPAIRFRGRVHETVRPSLEKREARTADSDIVLHHRGDLRALTEAVGKDLEYERLRSGRDITAVEELLASEAVPPPLGSVSAVLRSADDTLPALGRRIVERVRKLERRR